MFRSFNVGDNKHSELSFINHDLADDTWIDLDLLEQYDQRFPDAIGMRFKLSEQEFNELSCLANFTWKPKITPTYEVSPRGNRILARVNGRYEYVTKRMLKRKGYSEDEINELFDSNNCFYNEVGESITSYSISTHSRSDSDYFFMPFIRLWWLKNREVLYVYCNPLKDYRWFKLLESIGIKSLDDLKSLDSKFLARRNDNASTITSKWEFKEAVDFINLFLHAHFYLPEHINLYHGKITKIEWAAHYSLPAYYKQDVFFKVLSFVRSGIMDTMVFENSGVYFLNQKRTLVVYKKIGCDDKLRKRLNNIGKSNNELDSYCLPDGGNIRFELRLRGVRSIADCLTNKNQTSVTLNDIMLPGMQVKLNGQLIDTIKRVFNKISNEPPGLYNPVVDPTVFDSDNFLENNKTELTCSDLINLCTNVPSQAASLVNEECNNQMERTGSDCLFLPGYFPYLKDQYKVLERNNYKSRTWTRINNDVMKTHVKNSHLPSFCTDDEMQYKMITWPYNVNAKNCNMICTLENIRLDLEDEKKDKAEIYHPSFRRLSKKGQSKPHYYSKQPLSKLKSYPEYSDNGVIERSITPTIKTNYQRYSFYHSLQSEINKYHFADMSLVNLLESRVLLKDIIDYLSWYLSDPLSHARAYACRKELHDIFSGKNPTGLIQDTINRGELQFCVGNVNTDFKGKLWDIFKANPQALDITKTILEYAADCLLNRVTNINDVLSKSKLSTFTVKSSKRRSKAKVSKKHKWVKYL